MTFRLSLCLVSCAALSLVVGCPGDDDSTSSTTVAASTGSNASTTNASTTDAASTGSVDTSTSTPGESTTNAADCGDATDQASCSAAQNLGEGGGCTWMVIHELTITDGACDFTTTDRGACVGTDGLDDGCNGGFMCDVGNAEVYYSELRPGTWEVARGQACRGISGFLQCIDTLEEPCTCACEVP